MLAQFKIPLGILSDPAFKLWGTATTWGEIAAFVSGAICVYLVAKQKVWNWPIGIINAIFFLLLFFNFGLYADSGLQVVYITLGVYGWWCWKHGGDKRDELKVSRTTTYQWAALIAATAAVTAGLWLLLDQVTDSTVPQWDALTTALSLAATWGQCRKKVESWWIWITADIIYIPLYAYKDLWLTAILYVVFMILCIIGLREWRADLAQRPQDGLTLNGGLGVPV